MSSDGKAQQNGICGRPTSSRFPESSRLLNRWQTTHFRHNTGNSEAQNMRTESESEITE